MSDLSEPVAVLWDLAASLRGFAQPLLQWDVVRGLLFLRHISDPPSAQQRRLVLPDSARWSYLQSQVRGIAFALGQACRDLEAANPWMEGTLTDDDFHQVERGDLARQDEVLHKLIEAVSWMKGLEDPARVGAIYDSLVTRFAESAGKSGDGLVFVAVPVARLMVDLLDLQDGVGVCDPVCRAGRPLTACATFAAERGLHVALEGQEPSEKLRAICKMNLFLRGADEARIELGNVLRTPKLVDDRGQLQQYERVLTAPPINQEFPESESAAQDPWHRFPIVPPKQNADYAYVLHCLSILQDGGRAVILTSRGVLFRQGSEAAIRKLLLQHDHFEAVIGLPGGLLYGTHIPAALLVLRKGARPHKGKVLFVEVRRSSERRARHEALLPEEIDAIATCVRRFEAVPGMSVVVDQHEIEEHGWTLNPAVYIPGETQQAGLDFQRRRQEILQLEAQRDDAASRVDELLGQLARELEIGE